MEIILPQKVFNKERKFNFMCNGTLTIIDMTLIVFELVSPIFMCFILTPLPFIPITVEKEIKKCAKQGYAIL